MSLVVAPAGKRAEPAALAEAADAVTGAECEADAAGAAVPAAAVMIMQSALRAAMRVRVST
jgi:hypothetical protein